MLSLESRESIIGFSAESLRPSDPAPDKSSTEPAEEEDILDIALRLLEDGRAEIADKLLTAALLDMPFDERLWLAAGLCRLRLGAVRSAACAFEMSAWLADEPTARELLTLCGEIRV